MYLCAWISARQVTYRSFKKSSCTLWLYMHVNLNIPHRFVCMKMYVYTLEPYTYNHWKLIVTVHACVYSHLVSTCTRYANMRWNRCMYICLHTSVYMYICLYICLHTSVAVCIHMYIFMQIDLNVQIQPNAEMVTQNLVSIPSNFYFITRCTGTQY